MEYLIDNDHRTIDFSISAFEVHVKKAIDEAIHIAGPLPLSAHHVLQGILIQIPIPNSAFSKIQSYFPGGSTDRSSSNTRPIGGPVSAELPLLASLQIAKRFLAVYPKMWGRDLVTIVLLTKGDETLNAFLKENGIALDYLQDLWFEYLTQTISERSNLDVVTWWQDAGIPIPSDRRILRIKKNVSNEDDHGPIGNFDVFLLHSAADDVYASVIYEKLISWNIKVYFWKYDMGYGLDWRDTEQQYINAAKIVIVTLGENGWGPHQLTLTLYATEHQKKIIPVAIGGFSIVEAQKANGLFDVRRYVDLKNATESSFNELRNALIQMGFHLENQTFDTPLNFESIIRSVVDGDEQQRSKTVERLRDSNSYDRNGLSARLRSEIEKYRDDANLDFTRTPRHPGKITSIRSWLISCLLWTEPESSENKELFLRHLSSAHEKDLTVRYWILAGLYQRNVSYLNESLRAAIVDGPSEVYFLAQAISSQADQNLISSFRQILSGESKLDQWRILRVLRIIPFIDLVDSVCDIIAAASEKESVLYDAFYALCHADTAKKAAPFLSNSPGVSETIERLFVSIAGADPRNVSELLSIITYFDSNELDLTLRQLMTRPDLIDIIRNAQILVEESNTSAMQYQVSKPGYISDELDISDDPLDVREEANTLTAVILSKDVRPPLAIGLFGDWGHGKSYFMSTIRDQVNNVKNNNRYTDTFFCKDVVQIEFNAWHYVDTNLWASLVSHILLKLSEHVSPGISYEENHTSFLAELDSTKKIIDETKAQQNIAKKEMEVKQAELTQVQAERENKKIELKELRAEDFYSILAPDQQKALDKALKDLGIPEVRNSLKNLEAAIEETSTTTGRMTSFVYSVLGSRNAWIIIMMIALVIIIIPGFQYLLKDSDFINQFFVATIALTMKISTIVGAIYLALTKGLEVINDALKKLNEIKTKAEAVMKSKRINPNAREIALQNDINGLTAKERETILILDSAVRRAAELEERIRLLNQERSLNRFLTDRTTSEDYRKHLGIISTIRQDFETLTTRLATAYLNDGNKFNKVDRIILYIDDLDRCPSEKVMEVLQAVHLLLAYPLFVVIVGVDPRWLLHSLGSSFSAFEHSNTNKSEGEWLSTPQNFLEKIFQIQFSIRPMGFGGYEKLITSLLDDPKPGLSTKIIETKAKASRTPSLPSVIGRSTALHRDSSETPAFNLSDDQITSDQNDTISPQTSDASPKRVDVSKDADRYTINEDALLIKTWETHFAARLFHFIPSPRAAKRFSNMYRLVKAGIPRKDLARFEGSIELPGEFQVPMLLLAVVTGSSLNAVKLFPQLVANNASDGSVNKSLDSILVAEKDSLRYKEFLRDFMEITQSNNFPESLTLFNEWIPKIARYSFDLNRILHWPRRNDSNVFHKSSAV